MNDLCHRRSMQKDQLPLFGERKGQSSREGMFLTAIVARSDRCRRGEVSDGLMDAIAAVMLERLSYRSDYRVWCWEVSWGWSMYPLGNWDHEIIWREMGEN